MTNFRIIAILIILVFTFTLSSKILSQDNKKAKDDQKTPEIEFFAGNEKLEVKNDTVSPDIGTISQVKFGKRTITILSTKSEQDKKLDKKLDKLGLTAASIDSVSELALYQNWIIIAILLLSSGAILFLLLRERNKTSPAAVSAENDQEKEIRVKIRFDTLKRALYYYYGDLKKIRDIFDGKGLLSEEIENKLRGGNGYEKWINQFNQKKNTSLNKGNFSVAIKDNNFSEWLKEKVLEINGNFSDDELLCACARKLIEDKHIKIAAQYIKVPASKKLPVLKKFEFDKLADFIKNVPNLTKDKIIGLNKFDPELKEIVEKGEGLRDKEIVIGEEDPSRIEDTANSGEKISDRNQNNNLIKKIEKFPFDDLTNFLDREKNKVKDLADEIQRKNNEIGQLKIKFESEENKWKKSLNELNDLKEKNTEILQENLELKSEHTEKKKELDYILTENKKLETKISENFMPANDLVFLASEYKEMIELLDPDNSTSIATKIRDYSDTFIGMVENPYFTKFPVEKDLIYKLTVILGKHIFNNNLSLINSLISEMIEDNKITKAIDPALFDKVKNTNPKEKIKVFDNHVFNNYFKSQISNTLKALSFIKNLPKYINFEEIRFVENEGDIYLKRIISAINDLLKREIYYVELFRNYQNYEGMIEIESGRNENLKKLLPLNYNCKKGDIIYIKSFGFRPKYGEPDQKTKVLIME